MGLSFGYHDSACCVLSNGQLIAAAQEERFTRIKNDASVPCRAFRYCLQEAGLTISDVDCVAYYEDPTLKLGRQVWMLSAASSPERRDAIIDRLVAPTPVALIRTVLGFDKTIEVVPHHLAHAASAYYFSGFAEAAVLTADGVGEWATCTYGGALGGTIELFDQVDFPHSLGLFYSAITSYLGFEVNEGEYKVMGLAPYGRPTYADRLRNVIASGAGGQFTLDLQYFAFLERDSMYSSAFEALLGEPRRRSGEPIRQSHMDIARSAQVVLEEVLLEKVRYLHGVVPSKNLCMAGGVALNVVANSRCLRDGPFQHLFVQPAAGDAGAALGAAAAVFVRTCPSARQCAPLSHVYLGPSNEPSDVRELLSGSPAVYEDFDNDEAALVGRTVDYLIDGKIVGWCQGRMEFGPRALGNRSILADPRPSVMRDRINAVVKKREAFRPFAPAVPEHLTPQHFDLDHPSPFMLEVCRVVSPVAMPAITHVDGTARVQTVDRDSNPRFFALLEEFHARTGCPALLNTSFNVRGEPIVCSALDAILCFVGSGLDALVIENCLIDRAGIPALWELAARQRQFAGATAIDHSVYALL